MAGTHSDEKSLFRHTFRKSIFRQSAETPLLAKLVPRDSASNFTRQLTNLETSPPECHHKCTKKDIQTNITNRIPRIKIRIKGYGLHSIVFLQLNREGWMIAILASL